MHKHPKLIVLTGQRFGRWLVGEQAGNTPRGGALWRCVCDCGNMSDVVGSDLRTGKSLSCGCAGSRATLGEASRTHGETGTRLYFCWQNMRARCQNPKNTHFAYYGGRGITVCGDWEVFETFRRWAESSGYDDALTIERVDVNGNYEPMNCTWVPAPLQSINRRFVSKDADGVLWWHRAVENGISAAAYRSRLCDGWPIEEAATWPMGRRRVARPRDAEGKFI